MFDIKENSISVNVNGEMTPIGMLGSGVDVVNNLTTTESGHILDARQGKALDDKITGIQQDLTQLQNKFPNRVTVTENDLPFRFEKHGNIVVCIIPTVTPKTLSAWGSLKLCDIPQGYTPSFSFFYPICFQDTPNHYSIFFSVSGSTLSMFNQSNGAKTTTNTMVTTIAWLTN